MMYKIPRGNYVYLLWHNGAICYVGRGVGGRCFSEREFDCDYMSIVCDNLSLEEATPMEIWLIKQLEPWCMLENRTHTNRYGETNYFSQLKKHKAERGRIRALFAKADLMTPKKPTP